MSKKNEEENDLGTIEMSSFCCGHCMGEKWDVYIGRNEETERDYLIIRCGDNDCVKRMEAALEKSGEVIETDSVLWKIFDVTGQFDNADMLYIPNVPTSGESSPNEVN